ncbi:MAG: hypothetical protein RLY16_1423 [Bacteroidota bacterium]
MHGGWLFRTKKNKQMKKVFQFALIIAMMIPAMSFAQTKKPVWAEMKKFHYFMSTSFHPAEEGNFAPLKAKVDSMFAAAQAWEDAAVPADFKPEETKKTLKLLTIKVAALKKAVEAKLDDKELARLIADAHDVFHKVAGECRKED